MAGYVEDRWYKKDDKGNRTIKTDRHGQGKRYKVAGIPGVRARSFPDKQKKAADAWLAKAIADSNKGEFIDPRDGNILLRDYVEKHWWPSRTGDPATLQTVGHRIRGQILPHLGSTPLRLIKVDSLRVWLKQLESEVAPGTAVVAWGYLNNILECAVDDERISKNPCRAPTLKPPSAPRSKARAWTRSRVLAVQAQLPEHYRVLVDIGAGAGLRQGEALALSEDDIDVEGGFIHVRRQIRSIEGKLAFSLPKGNKTRTVPMPDHLAQRLAQHLERFPAKPVTLPWKDPRPPTSRLEAKERAPQTHRLLVVNRNGNAVRANMWNEDHWKWALAEAGVIPKPKRVPRKSGTGTRLVYGPTHEMGFHSLRHTYASVQLDSRENPVAVSKWLGHADASITLRVYGHFMPEADGRGRQALDAWFARTDDPAPSSPDAPQRFITTTGEGSSLPRQSGELRQSDDLETVLELQESAEAIA
ncbi:site-specific integrase [Streptomyces sp. NBC_00140]|uniref:tyrosine-type recombinase/integrase n=1 Tax=Streptomyces sp. NBC_00140 TaxID=2975664 RepID=UPI002252FA13|nr:site-specific integrase [Streptomyces sp. NBC_00140]MCX5336960.1 site-specific integrase [Streptomyces sp. NBC_00140]MCX5338443.1 site-specific integrase [Streptomyces sp. NBC_00140]